MKKLSLYLSICLMFAFTVCAPALAADPPPAALTAPADLAKFLRQTVFPLTGSLLMGVLTIFLQRLGAKYKIQSLMDKENLVTQLAYQGITLAQERAAQLAGSKLALTKSQKLDIAVNHILEIMPKVSPERAQAVTHAVLAQIPGVGATGDKAFSFGAIVSAATAELPPAVEPAPDTAGAPA